MPRTLWHGAYFVFGLWLSLVLLVPLTAPWAYAADPDLARMEGLLVGDVNTFRRDNHLIELQRRLDLDAVARAHSEDMALRSYLSHTSPEGLNWVARLERAGHRLLDGRRKRRPHQQAGPQRRNPLGLDPLPSPPPEPGGAPLQRHGHRHRTRRRRQLRLHPALPELPPLKNPTPRTPLRFSLRIAGRGGAQRSMAHQTLERACTRFAELAVRGRVLSGLAPLLLPR